jgi:hypothetical protein
MNLNRLGLNSYQQRLVNSGKVDLSQHPGPTWIASHSDGFETFAKTARMAMEMLEVMMLESQFLMTLTSHVEGEDFDNEFNDDGIEPGDVFGW